MLLAKRKGQTPISYAAKCSNGVGIFALQKGK